MIKFTCTHLHVTRKHNHVYMPTRKHMFHVQYVYMYTHVVYMLYRPSTYLASRQRRPPSGFSLQVPRLDSDWSIVATVREWTYQIGKVRVQISDSAPKWQGQSSNLTPPPNGKVRVQVSDSAHPPPNAHITLCTTTCTCNLHCSYMHKHLFACTQLQVHVYNVHADTYNIQCTCTGMT